MTQLELVKMTAEEVLAIKISQAIIKGSIVELETKSGEHLNIMLYDHEEDEINEPYFALSIDGINECHDCKCKYFAYIYGYKACAIALVDYPDHKCKDEFDYLTHIYPNPLTYYCNEK